MRVFLPLIFTLAFLCDYAFGSVTVQVNGSNHTIPQTNEKGWGTNVTAWIQAISQFTLQPSGGTFTLTAEVSTGATYGFKVPYIKTQTATPSTAGVLRLARTDSVGWRNQLDNANLLLEVDSSNRLTFNSVVLANSTLSNLGTTAANASLIPASNGAIDLGSGSKFWAFGFIDEVFANFLSDVGAVNRIGFNTADTVITGGTNGGVTLNSTAAGNFVFFKSGAAPTSGQVWVASDTAGTGYWSNTFNASTATALAANPADCSADTYAHTIAASGALTCSTVTNAGLAGSIAANKLAALTASRVVISDVSGFISAADTATYPTLTELSYVKGLTSAAQTQINAATTSSSNPYKISNCSLAASVGSSALTVALKDATGSDPSGGSPCTLSFRNATATTGTYADVSATAATSVVASNGSSLGCIESVACTIYVYAINNAGTAELAMVTSRVLDEGGVQTSTAEGGSGAADTVGTLYSTSARASKAVRLLGRVTVTPAASFAWTNSVAEISNAPFLPAYATTSKNTTGPERVARARIAITGASTGTFTDQDGTCFAGTITVSSKLALLPFTESCWNGKPTCVVTCNDSTGRLFPFISTGNAFTDDQVEVGCADISGTPANSNDVQVICMGPGN